jgi:hypothetical protein
MKFGLRDRQAHDCRERLAADLERLTEVSPPAGSLSSRAPLRYDAVDACRGDLQRLAADLTTSEPVSSEGVRMAKRLLTDPASPVYSGGPEELSNAVRAARRALEAA